MILRNLIKTITRAVEGGRSVDSALQHYTARDSYSPEMLIKIRQRVEARLARRDGRTTC